jgi:DNA-binding NarL/FixJ family response regulator
MRSGLSDTTCFTLITSHHMRRPKRRWLEPFVAKAVKTLRCLSAIRIDVLSARDPEANRPRALQAGARAYFHKPADMPDLLEAIRTQLNV